MAKLERTLTGDFSSILKRIVDGIVKDTEGVLYGES